MESAPSSKRPPFLVRWVTAERNLPRAVWWVAVGGVTFAIFSWLGSSWLLAGSWPWDVKSDPNRLDLTKFALTILAGAGALVALVVAYRRQKDVEDGRFVERFGAAAEKLGAETPAERLAGAYAMAGAADRHPKLAQQCVDVLCGYLRLPFDPDPTSSSVASKKVTRSTPGADGTSETTETTYKYVPHDREVRDTIIRLLAERLHKDCYPGWHGLKFDMRGASLTTAPFRSTFFRGALNLEGATFLGKVEFMNARFEGSVRLNATLFSESADFAAARFFSNVTFSDAIFKDVGTFEGVRSYKEAYFEKTVFKRSAWFGEARFSGKTGLQGMEFGQGSFSCKGAVFKGELRTQSGQQLEPTTEWRPLQDALS